MVYSYPVIFDIYNVKGVKVTIPDLDCHKIFNSIEDGIDGVKSLLKLLDSAHCLPKPSSLNDIKIKDNEFIVLVNISIDKNNRVYDTDKLNDNKIEKCSKDFKSDSKHPTNDDKFHIEYLKESYTVNEEIDEMLSELEDNYKKDLFIKDLNIMMNIKAIACKNETYIDADRYDFLHPQFIGLVTSYIINTDLVMSLRCYKVKDILNIYKG